MTVFFLLFDAEASVPIGLYSSIERAKVAARRVADMALANWCVIRMVLDSEPSNHTRIVYACSQDGKGYR